MRRQTKKCKQNVHLVPRNVAGTPKLETAPHSINHCSIWTTDPFSNRSISTKVLQYAAVSFFSIFMKSFFTDFVKFQVPRMSSRGLTGMDISQLFTKT